MFLYFMLLFYVVLQFNLFVFALLFEFVQIYINLYNILMNSAFNLLAHSFEEVVKSEIFPVKREGAQKNIDINELSKKIHENSKKARQDVAKLDRSIEAYFIGPRGENIKFFTQLILKAIDSHCAAREEYELEDARHISRKMKNETSFLDAQDKLQRALSTVLTKLKDMSPPFYSSRYFGHMIWQTTIPSLVGSFATMLYNPNNCAFEASPFTTLLQIDVMKQFAKVFNFPPFLSSIKANDSATDHSWGHLTCGGTIANCQSFWAARNCRFLSFSIRKYIQSIENTNNIKDIQVRLCNGSSKKLLELNAWQILNITNEDTMKLNDLAFKTIYPKNQQNEKNFAIYQDGVSKHSIGKRGFFYLYQQLILLNNSNPIPEWNGIVPDFKVFVSATAHYSIRKSLSILGFGEGAVEPIVVDLDSRVCVDALKAKLQKCLQTKQPVLTVVGIVGTTEQSTVDNLKQILNYRNTFSSQGLYFHFHIDGAYGGYFTCMLKEVSENHLNSFSEFVQEQLKTFCHADSITFDPHKTGYVPYTCGGIIYRNHRLRDNLSFSAPYIYTGAQQNMSIYGIEGSKPGSSVTSVYLSLQVLPLVRGGHGQLLERTLVNSKLFAANLSRVGEQIVNYKYNNNQSEINQRFECCLLPRFLWEKDNKPELKQKEKQAIITISEGQPQSLQSIVEGDNYVRNVYLNLGPDLNIICYGINFTDPVTRVANKSLKKYNEFNRTLINLSKPVGTDINVRMKDLYVSETEISQHLYGEEIYKDFLKRHNLVDDQPDKKILLIRSTIMNAFFIEPVVEKDKQNNSRLVSSNRVFIRQILQNACQTLVYLKWR